MAKFLIKQDLSKRDQAKKITVKTIKIIILKTLFSLSNFIAWATARNVLPVPAGPVAKTISYFSNLSKILLKYFDPNCVLKVYFEDFPYTRCK